MSGDATDRGRAVMHFGTPVVADPKAGGVCWAWEKGVPTPGTHRRGLAVRLLHQDKAGRICTRCGLVYVPPAETKEGARMTEALRKEKP